MADRNVVMLAYWYPPCSSYPTAAARTAGFARHLARHGWNPTVLVPRLDATTCGCPACSSRDTPTVASEVGADVDVVRIPVLPSPAFRAWSRVRPAQDRWSPTVQGMEPGDPDQADGRTAEAVRGAMGRWASAATAPARALVELRTAWRGVAAAELDRHLPGADVLWTTSWPFAHTTIGSRAARRHGIPWVADLRDPVSRVGGEVGAAAVAVRLRRRLRARELRGAARVIEVTDPLADLDTPWLGRRPEVITSGFDAEAWRGVEGRRRRDAFTLLLTGSFYRGLNEPRPFLEVLRAFLEGRPAVDRGSVRLVYHGRQGALLREQARQVGVHDVVEDRGWVDERTLRPWLRGADVLVLQANTLELDGVPGGKFYEYLAAGPHVLAHPGTDRFVRDVLERTGAGSSPEDARAAVSVLAGLHERWRAGEPLAPGRDEAAVARHDQRVGAARLGAILDEVVARSAS